MKILLATDGSRFAENAAAFLAHLPHSQKLDLVILSVAETPLLHGSQEVVSWIKSNQEAEKKNCESACKSAAEMFTGANANVSWMTTEGHVAKRIVKCANDIDADLIVVGAKGHSLLSRVLLGSVSDFVARHADCSVLVVRHPVLGEKERKELSICVAHDFSAPAEFAATQIAEFDWRHNTQFRAVSVLPIPKSYIDLPIPFDTESVRRAAEESLDDFAESLEALSSDISTHVVEAEHTGECIVKFAERNETDLIVMGGTGHGLLDAFPLGGVSNFVLNHANCSVWIARDRNSRSKNTSQSAAVEVTSRT